MPDVHYALLEPEAEGGFTVTFPEIGYGATHGAAWDKALRQAEDMLEEAILGMIAHSEDVPEPAPEGDAPDQDTSRRAPIALPALTAAKLELYRAMRETGLDEAQLAERLGWPAKKITHVFDG
jgi:antitoxin HicB